MAKGTIHNLRPHAAMVLLHVPRSAPAGAAHRSGPGTDVPESALPAALTLGLLQHGYRNPMPLCARTARLLLMLVEQRHAMHGIELSLKLTRDDFPDMPGVTRQILNRELKALEEQGLPAIALFAYHPARCAAVAQHGGADGSRPGSHRLSHWRNPQTAGPKIKNRPRRILP